MSSNAMGIAPDYDPLYVEHVILPFLRTCIYEGERPGLPMIDVPLSKDQTLPQETLGLYYAGWQPVPERDGETFFAQALEGRGPHNLRKKIFASALTPDLYAPMYSGKVAKFFDSWLDQRN